MIACAEKCAQHPEAQELWETIRRQLHRKGPSVIPELIRQSFGSATDVTETQIKEAEMRIARVLIRIARGLYFADKDVPLLNDVEVRVNLSPVFSHAGGLAEVIKTFEAEPGCIRRNIGNGVFRYRMVSTQTNVLWLLVFYDCLPFLCDCHPHYL
jgi:hypothetical protein